MTSIAESKRAVRRAARERVSPQRRRARRREAAIFALLILPNLTAILVFSYWPTVYNLVLSFTDWDFIAPSPVWVGIKNYLDLFRNPEFATVLWNTIVFTVTTVFGSLVIGLAIGLLVSRRTPISGFTRTVVFMPHMIPGAVAGIVWLFMFDPAYGLSRWVFEAFGAASPQWTSTSGWSLAALIIAYSWQRIGFVAIIYYTAILDLPRDIYEAAAIDGAAGWKMFRFVTFPLLAPVNVFLVTTGIIASTQAFDIIATLTEGGPGVSSSTITWAVYEKAFQEFDIGESAALSMVLFVLLMAVTAWQLRFANRKVESR